MSAPSTTTPNGDATTPGAATPGRVTVGTPSRAQAHVDCVNEVMATGLSKSAAVKQTADEDGLATGTVYDSLRKLSGASVDPAHPQGHYPGRPDRAAKKVLQDALDNIDIEIKRMNDASVVAHKTAKESAADRKANLKKRIQALSNY